MDGEMIGRKETTLIGSEELVEEEYKAAQEQEEITQEVQNT